MSEANKPFVVTDRRRFTVEGEVRPDAPPPTDRAPAEHAPAATSPEPAPAPPEPRSSDNGPRAVPPPPPVAAQNDSDGPENLADFPAPTEEQTEQSRRAYQATADRIDTAIRASNPGMEHPPAANFEQLVQSLYMTAIVQLGGATAEGQQPQIDLLGARSSIDLLGVLSEKTHGNLSTQEEQFLSSALFEVRMAFLEITQALARQATAKAAESGIPAGTTPFGAPPLRPGPVGGKR